MSVEIFVANEKHGTALYANALRIVKDRLDTGDWYDGDDAATAEAIVATAATDHDAAELAAWRFLRTRNDHEYENVEKVTVRQ